MKTEFDCPRCQSTLRVDAENGGKPVRCPVCGNVAIAPLADSPVETPDPVVSLKPEPLVIKDDEPVREAGSWRSLDPQGDPGNKPAVDPWLPPARPVRPSPIRPQPTGGPNDGYWTFAMVAGILALVLHVSVCGCGTVISAPLSLAGLIAAYNSTSANRRAPIMINWIALAISLAGGALLFVAGVLRAAL
jgi:hypothetical protein